MTRAWEEAACVGQKSDVCRLCLCECLWTHKLRIKREEEQEKRKRGEEGVILFTFRGGDINKRSQCWCRRSCFDHGTQVHTHAHTYTHAHKYARERRDNKQTKKTSLGQFFTKDFNKVQTHVCFCFSLSVFVIVVVAVFFFLLIELL